MTNIQKLLSRLRYQVRRYIVWDSALAVLAVILVAFWLAFLVDFLPVRIGGSEMPRSARWIALITTLAIAAALLWRFLISPLRRDLPDDSLALLIERQHPEIGGRLVTAVQLGETPRAGDAHDVMFIRQVYQEVDEQLAQVELHRIFRREPIRQKLMLVVPLLFALMAMAVASPQTFARAISRLTLLSDSPWPRKAQLEMLGVEVPLISASETDDGATELVKFQDGIVRLARGSNATLRIRAAGEQYGHRVPDLCTVLYTAEDGNRGQSNLRRVGRLVDGYQSFVLDGPPLSSLSQSVSLTIRGLDDRLTGYRIEVVDPPAIAQMQMSVRYPDYLRAISGEQEYDQQIDYQAGVRIREGSSLKLTGRSSVPLGSVDVAANDSSSRTTPSPMAGGETRTQRIAAEISSDRMSFTLPLDDVRQATSIRVVPRGSDGISAQAPYRYFIGVVRDEPPETMLRLSGIGSSITPIAILPIEVTATDDYGIESLSVEMTARDAVPKKQPESDEPAAQPASRTHTLSPILDRQGQAELTIDLRKLADESILAAVTPGGTVTLSTTARDRFDLAAPHVTQSELIRLQVVTAETLIATLERRELEFRSRLEQAIGETRSLRQTLTAIEAEAETVISTIDADLRSSPVRDSETPTPTEDDESSMAAPSDQLREQFRARQRVQLRIRQAELQAAKSTDELAGIVAGLDELLLEMLNNRIDSVDRRERLEQGVRTPLKSVVEEPFPLLRRQIVELERILMSGDGAASQQATAQDAAKDAQDAGKDDPAVDQMRTAVAAAVTTNDEILLQLSAVLEKMLDLESFNEILDLMRGLIQDQESLLEETQEEQQKRVLDLFK